MQSISDIYTTKNTQPIVLGIFDDYIFKIEQKNHRNYIRIWLNDEFPENEFGDSHTFIYIYSINENLYSFKIQGDISFLPENIKRKYEQQIVGGNLLLKFKTKEDLEEILNNLKFKEVMSITSGNVFLDKYV